MKRIRAVEEWCLGCKLCEVHCRTAHSKSKDIVKCYKKEAPSPARVVVEDGGDYNFALNCRHCKDAKCVKSCITGAMYRDPETGYIVNNPDKCIGCWTCVLACPYGAIMRDTSNKKIVAKCDMCAEVGTPACVANCPNQALILIEEEEEE
ncbi:MAG: 4Fe-4S dicluster domain-containing protein [Clostridia bacterium]